MLDETDFDAIATRKRAPGGAVSDVDSEPSNGVLTVKVRTLRLSVLANRPDSGSGCVAPSGAGTFWRTASSAAALGCSSGETIVHGVTGRRSADSFSSR